MVREVIAHLGGDGCGQVGGRDVPAGAACQLHPDGHQDRGRIGDGHQRTARHRLRRRLRGELPRWHHGDPDGSPSTGSAFAGWSGACSGSATCTVTLDQAKVVTAVFVPVTTSDVCSPRPPVRVEARPSGDGRLLVIVDAGRGTLRFVRIGTDTREVVNGAVDIPNGPAGVGHGYILQPSNATDRVTFHVRRLAPGAVTVPLVVTDECGAWQTFVGGGPHAF